MNGRIYDPTLGRFLQADPFIQASSNSQSYNRYSYVLNNPLSYTDPSGFIFKKIWKGIKPFIGIIVAVVATYYCGPECGKAAYAAIGATSGATQAAVNGGNVFRGALIGAFSAYAFHGVGDHFQTLANANASGMLTASQAFGKIAAHALTGGVMSVLQGGKFGHGFFAAGVTQGFAKSINGISSARFSLGRIAAAAVIGGAISKLTGGKFANGATTGAFSRLFNDEAAHQVRNKKYGKGYTNPLTGELEYSNVEGFTPRLVDGKLALGVDKKIMFFSREAQMEMGFRGYDSALVLQCQAMNDCTSGVNGPVPSNYDKPKISAKSSHLRVNLVGNGWFISKSIPSLAISAGQAYITTAYCGNSAKVVIKCTTANGG